MLKNVTKPSKRAAPHPVEQPLYALFSRVLALPALFPKCSKTVPAEPCADSGRTIFASDVSDYGRS